MGVYMDSLSDTGRFFAPMYGTSAGSTDFAPNPWLLLTPDGTSMEWTIEYDPDAAAGLGAVTITLDGQSRTLVLNPGDKAEGAILDRFGLFNMQDNNGKHSIVYLDDLTFTSALVVPGDFDGDVDGADFLLWQRGGLPNPISPSDLAAWETNYSTGSIVAASSAVPEPSAVFLAVVGSVALLFGASGRKFDFR